MVAFIYAELVLASSKSEEIFKFFKDTFISPNIKLLIQDLKFLLNSISILYANS